MDPYTEYLGINVLTRSEPSYRIPQPRARRSRTPRANRWWSRPAQR
jgi:hypothetical protein